MRMGVKVYTRQADNLLDLITLIAEAIGALGVNATWSGYEDGTLNMWSGEDGPILAIEPTVRPIIKESATKEGPWPQ